MHSGLNYETGLCERRQKFIRPKFSDKKLILSPLRPKKKNVFPIILFECRATNLLLFILDSRYVSNDRYIFPLPVGRNAKKVSYVLAQSVGEFSLLRKLLEFDRVNSFVRRSRRRSKVFRQV